MARTREIERRAMDYVLDVQGFRRSSNIFILKEAAIIALEKDALPRVYLLAPPCKWSKLLRSEQIVNQWLEKNYHGIPWEWGTVPYSRLVELLQSSLEDAGRIFVKGLDKKKWIEELLPRKCVINMEDLGCPSMRGDVLPVRCPHHMYYRKPTCASANALHLRDWLIEHDYGNNDDDNDDDDDDDEWKEISDDEQSQSSTHSNRATAESNEAVLTMY